MFFPQTVLAVVDPDNRHRSLVFAIEGMIDSLPPHLRDWLYAQYPFIKAVLFLIAHEHASLAVKILWRLLPLSAHELPAATNGIACMTLLVSHACHGPGFESPHRELAEKAGEFRNIHVPGLSALPDMLTSASHAMRLEGQKFIRGDDMVFTSRQTLVFAPFIRQNRIALRNLVRVADQCEAIVSLERGGALVADHLAALLRVPNISEKVPKLALPGAKYSKEEHIERFKRAILRRAGDGPEEITIGIAETVVGGGSANKVLEAVNSIVHQCPHVRFQMLFERHTWHNDGILGADFEDKLVAYSRALPYPLFSGATDVIKLSQMSALQAVRVQEPRQAPKFFAPANAVKVFIAKASYILGEDVDYQMAYDGPHAGKPLIIFDRVGANVRAIMLQPSGGHTAREMLVRLVLGAYDDVLHGYGLM